MDKMLVGAWASEPGLWPHWQLGQTPAAHDLYEKYWAVTSEIVVKLSIALFDHFWYICGLHVLWVRVTAASHSDVCSSGCKVDIAFILKSTAFSSPFTKIALVQCILLKLTAFSLVHMSHVDVDELYFPKVPVLFSRRSFIFPEDI